MPLAGLDQLAPPLAQSVQRMADDPEVGELRVTSGWRSSAAQVALRRQHCGPTAHDIYVKPSSQCSPPTAIPGRSNHEVTLGGRPWALAVDLSGDLAGAHRVMRRYGLHTPVKGEPWHFERIDTAALRVVAGAKGAVQSDDGLTVTVPGVGRVATGAVLTSSTSPPAPSAGGPSIWVRAAMFAGGLVLVGIAVAVITGRAAAGAVLDSSAGEDEPAELDDGATTAALAAAA